MKHKLLTKMTFIITLVIMFMIGGHLMDVGDVIGDTYDYATNGFFQVHPSKIYHIGYYMMYCSFIMMMFYALYLTIEKTPIPPE